MAFRRLRRSARPFAMLTALLVASGGAAASAQTLGTFPWQIAPYCNVVTFTISVDGAGFRLTGFDDQCGSTQLPAAGAVTLRSDGQYGLSFYVVTPTGLATHLTAVLSPASISGPWHDSAGNSGILAFNPTIPASGSTRPVPLVSTSGLADGAVTAAKVGAGAVDSLRIADGSVSTADLADDAVVDTKILLPFSKVVDVLGVAFGVENRANNTNIRAIYGVASLAGTGVQGSVLGNGQGVWGESAGSGTGVLGRSTSFGTGNAGRFENLNPSNTAAVLRVSTDDAASNDLIRAYLGGSDLKFKVTAAGNVTADGTFTGGGADVAEFVDTFDALEPGDVIEIDPARAGQFRRAASASSSAVAGVITTRPGLLMNATESHETLIDGPALALSGRVPVKVSAENGAIAPGDLLVSSSTPGHAMKASAAPAAGTVVGKALGILASGTGVIDMLVMLR
jgi:hypothetical protein